MASDSARQGPGRPPAASKEAVEQIALAMMLRDGYDAVSVDAIAAAAGIGRTTFFRYFGSKPGVVWAPFDATIAWLESAVAEESSEDTLGTVRRAVVSSTRAALYASDVWLERFQLLDSHPSLRGDAYEHWERWKKVIADHVAAREECDPNDTLPMAIAGACQGVFLAELRNWRNSDDQRDHVVNRLDSHLALVCDALQVLLST